MMFQYQAIKCYNIWESGWLHKIGKNLKINVAAGNERFDQSEIIKLIGIKVKTEINYVIFFPI